MPLFKRASDYIGNRFGGRVQKIPVNAGFSCPNRDGTLSYEGCSYCNNSAFSPFYANASLSVAEQLSRGKQFFAARYGCHQFFAYFQSYSCTHADLDVLSDLYEQALAVEGVVGLVIATRPDCLSESVICLLADLAQKTSVRLEVGVESFCDEALQKANRCHDAKTALEALKLVSAKNIDLCAHLILGLPGESVESQLAGAGIVSSAGVGFVKLHHLQVVAQTPLARLYEANNASVPVYSVDEYLDIVSGFIGLLSTQIHIDRFLNRVPRNLLLAPVWNISGEAEFQRLLEQTMQKKGITQGYRYSGPL